MVVEWIRFREKRRSQLGKCSSEVEVLKFKFKIIMHDVLMNIDKLCMDINSLEIIYSLDLSRVYGFMQIISYVIF
jgi:hypothetical protein